MANDFGGDERERDERDQEHVDVNEGKRVFRELDTQIELEVRNVDNNNNEKKDVEAGSKEPEFNLQEYFEDSVRTNSAIGHKLKKMGLSVHNLTVVGQGADASYIPTNLSVILKVLWPGNWRSNHGTPFDIVHDVSGFCKDGEMLLVLGRPGAGCSTFLRMAANRSRKSFVKVEGTVTYGGLDASEFAQYGGEAIYIPEEDVHYPTLTVRQTMDFALKTKTPGQRLPEESKRTFRTKIFSAIMKMFGLTKQVDTLVGNEWIRGLSGGERKRMTISEAMVARGTIDCWDCSTRGLDAASALDYAKSLRVMTDSLHKTTVATFYQASESIYAQFDRVLVLEKGRCIYFGPASEAKQYFLHLGFDCEPRKSTPDFLTGITNPQERKVRPGYEAMIPRSAGELEAAWKRSQNCARAQQDHQAYDEEVRATNPSQEFKEEVLLNKSKNARPSSRYSATIVEQVLALTKRQWQIWMGNVFGLCSLYITLIIQGLIYGSLFYQMEKNATGLYLRGAAIFGAILYVAFIFIAELFETFVGRQILQRHKSYAMYHPSAFHLAQVLLDIPLVGSTTLIFSIIVYFMYGLDLVASKFFIFFFILWIFGMTVTQLFRLLGNLSPSLYLSSQALSLVFVLLFTYIGFAPTYDKMHPWFIWVYWVNPLQYAFSAMFANEMLGLVFDCATSGHVPAGPAYMDPAFRVCALPGATPGATQVLGDDYLRQVYSIETGNRGLYVMAILLFWVFYTICNVLAVEYITWASGGHTQHVYKRGKAPKQNDEEQERANRELVVQATSNIGNALEMRQGVFVWKQVKYSVPVKKSDLLLLNGVSGWIKPGQMTALMGASGAGKTTLLDVLAKRKTQGKVEGVLLLNGMPLRVDFERITGYVEQMDVHDARLTVREALRFSAKLRQDASVPVAEKEEYVERVLEMMDMKPLGDALVGTLESGKGISVEERKRLTIGMELVAKPHILFLDEPTSGLDAQSSYNIIKFIRKLADAGMPLVCTIHQPSSVLFEYFDRLLLLAKGGKTVYFGDIGPQSRVMLDYFERNGARHCEDHENPAEYILEAIGAGITGHTDKDWHDVWTASQENADVERGLEGMTQVSGKDGASLTPAQEYATSPFYQTFELYKRFNTVYWRNPAYNAGRVFNALLVGLVVGFSFWNLGTSSSDVTLIILAIFQIIILGALLIESALPEFVVLRDAFQRAYASKIYSPAPFVVALIATDLPYLLVAASLCFVCCFWSIGFDTYNSAGNIAFFWIAFVLFLWFCNSLGQLIGAMSPDPGIAYIFMPLLTTILFLFCGVLAPPSSMPEFWSSWLYHLNPFRYFMEALITNTLSGLVVKCTPEDLLPFRAPATETCASYSADFFSYGARGYVEDLGNNLCGYCVFSSGQDFYEPIGWDEQYKDRGLGILMAYFVFNIIAASLFVYIFRKPKK